MVKSVFNFDWFALFDFLFIFLLFGFIFESILFFSSCFRFVFSKKFEEGFSLVSGECVGKLINDGWDIESLV